MTAAAPRSVTPSGVPAEAKKSPYETRLGANDRALLEALPIAAAIFTLNEDRLWVEAMNPRFLELAGCHGDAG